MAGVQQLFLKQTLGLHVGDASSGRDLGLVVSATCKGRDASGTDCALHAGDVIASINGVQLTSASPKLEQAASIVRAMAASYMDKVSPNAFVTVAKADGVAVCVPLLFCGPHPLASPDLDVQVIALWTGLALGLNSASPNEFQPVVQAVGDKSNLLTSVPNVGDVLATVNGVMPRSWRHIRELMEGVDHPVAKVDLFFVRPSSSAFAVAAVKPPTVASVAAPLRVRAADVVV
jgi:hypothetical protein